MTNLLQVDWTTIPAPTDDGAASHLLGLRWPAIVLPATDGRMVDVSALQGVTVVYAYPMTGRPGLPLPEGGTCCRAPEVAHRNPVRSGTTSPNCSNWEYAFAGLAIGLNALLTTVLAPLIVGWLHLTP